MTLVVLLFYLFYPGEGFKIALLSLRALLSRMASLGGIAHHVISCPATPVAVSLRTLLCMVIAFL